jgi:hypothetical protein
LDQVAGEFDPVSVVFVWSNEAKWSASKVSKQGRSTPSQTDLELAAGFLAGDRKLNPGDQVLFHCELPAAPMPAEDLSVVVPPSSVTGTVEMILTEKGMKAWIEQQNTESIPQIVQSLRSAMGVIPFLGAGTSFDFKYPLWGPFFEGLANAAAAEHKLKDAIRTPAAIRGELTAPAIVKLNGGIDPLGRWPESFVVASSDFEELSTRVPDLLPQVVWDALRTRSILFLGHGLREPDVRAIIRRRKREEAPMSWAVQLGKAEADIPYWRVAGIELIDADLSVYVDRLESALDRRGSPTLPPPYL